MQINRFRHHLTKILVDIMFFGGILACAAVPFVLPGLVTYESSLLQIANTTIFVAAGICSVYIMYQLKLMFKTLLSGNPFVNQNISCLRKCAVASAAITLIFVIRIIFLFTISAAFTAVIFLMLSLFCLTIKDLFKQAVAYKEETDWTV